MSDDIFNVQAFARLVAVEVAYLLEQSLGDDILTTVQAARLLKVHPITVSKLASKGDLPGRKLGRDWRFRRSDLLRHISEGAMTAEKS